MRGSPSSALLAARPLHGDTISTTSIYAAQESIGRTGPLGKGDGGLARERAADRSQDGGAASADSGRDRFHRDHQRSGSVAAEFRRADRIVPRECADSDLRDSRFQKETLQKQ